jgi:hypothetical protein
MGHHARTLTALLAVLATTLVVSSTAAARPSVVRVETKSYGSVGTGAFVNRVAVDTTGDVTITDSTGVAPPASCAATSPVAAVLAAVGAGQLATTFDATTSNWAITSVKGLSQPPPSVPPAAPAGPAWVWRLYVDQAPIDANEACKSAVPIGSEVLLYQACGSKTQSCYSGTPLYMRVRDGGPYDIASQTVPGRGAPVAVRTIGDRGPTGAVVSTDEGFSSGSLPTGPLAGQTAISFREYGPHGIIATKGDGSRPPARLALCVTEGNDGFCGSTRYQPPDEIPYDASSCATNGHDGFCGTIDATGPVTHVTNMTQKKQFKKKKGPGQVTGTIDIDPNRVKYVKLRLTRVTTSRVLIKPAKNKKAKAKKSAAGATATAAKGKAKKKPAKKRYRTVKRCTAWSDTTALLESAKCGAKYAKWFDAELDDLRTSFSYSFAMTLPAGTYTLEVEGADENGFKDLPAPGRNVLAFVVL